MEITERRNVCNPEKDNQFDLGIITLKDNKGKDVDFEYFDYVNYEGKMYLIMHECADNTDGYLDITVMEYQGDQFIGVSDQSLIDAVFDIFKQKYLTLV